MNKFLQKSIGGLAAFCLVAPSSGYSFLYKGKEAKRQTPVTHAPYGEITPNIAVRDIGRIKFDTNTHGTNQTTALVGKTLGLGIGLNPEFGWRDLIRIKGCALVSGGRSVLTAATNKFLAVDTDGALTFFTPVSHRIDFLLIGGWEYKWMRLTYKAQGLNSDYTAAKLRVNGPFGGFGLSFQPSSKWRIESGVTYHGPRGTGYLRTRDANGNPAPAGAWLDKVEYRGARFGLGGYFGANWKTSQHWSLDFNIEGRTLVARGQHFGAPSATVSESGMETMQICYINYGFGLNYTF